MAARNETHTGPARVDGFAPANHRNGHDEEGGLVLLVKRMADGLEHLVSAHLELVRLELKQDARQLALQLGKMLAFLPLMLSGLIVLVAGLGFLLGTQVGLWQGLLIVGGATLVVSGLGFYLMLKSFRAPKVLDDTGAEMRETKEQIKDGAKRLTSDVPREAGHAAH